MLVSVVAGCASELDAREGRILDALADDNYMWAQREPELVSMKLRKMQRGPYEWLRGTALLYWRDATDLSGDRTVTQFGSPEASRVLVVGDPHVENVGTYRAADGTMVVDWNDFDGTAYGPYHVDLRRLAASFSVLVDLAAPGNRTLATDIVRAIVASYVATIAELSTGARVAALGRGASELFDDALTRAATRGAVRFALDEVAPVVDGLRVLAVGDLEPVAPDNVLEDRLFPVTADEASWLDRAIEQWRRDVGLDAVSARVLLRGRRIGAGVASYPARRYNLVLAGATAAPDDDLLVELKETRDSFVVPRVPQLAAAEWNNPAERVVATQRRLHARPDSDPLLGAAMVGGLSVRLRDREAFQRGINAEDVAELVTDDPAALRSLATLYGRMLARAHGVTGTADGVPGYTVIAPLIAGRDASFIDEIVAAALADADQIRADADALRDRDLAPYVLFGGP